MSYPAIELDKPVSISHLPKINKALEAVSSARLFAVREEPTGLQLRIYGGVYPTTSGPVIVSDGTVNLTASATNYIYVDTSAVVQKVTASPSGWPGPLANGGRALYQLTVGADAITASTCYIVGPTVQGANGPPGATGDAGSELGRQRKWWTEVGGAGETATLTSHGFEVTSTISTISARSLASTSFSDSIAYTAYGATGVGDSAQIYSKRFCFRGNATGRGGFDITLRVRFESTFSSTNGRRFIGLYDTSAGVFGNVEPDTILNLVGVGSKAGDANLSTICNDGSGAATMATLGANFPALATDNIYEVRLYCDANASGINYTITDAGTGNTASGALSSNIPANTVFLGWYVWTNTGSQATTTTFGVLNVGATTRY